MTAKVLDTGGVERTISQIKVMDVGNIERTIAFVRVLDVGGVVREVFTAGGGGGGGGSGATTAIEPAYLSQSGRSPASRSAIFKAKHSGSDIATYAWGVVSGPGAVSAGGTTDSATLTVFGSPNEQVEATFFCDMTFGGATYRATCTFAFYYVSGTGGGGQVQQ